MSSIRERSPGIAVWVAVAAAGFVLIGSLGPWSSTLGQHAPGTDGDGVITIFLALLALGGIWAAHASRKTWPIVVVLVLACMTIVIGVADLASINDTSDLADRLSRDQDLMGALTIKANADALRSPAWGIYLVLVGGVVLAGAAVAIWRDSRRRRQITAGPTAHS